MAYPDADITKLAATTTRAGMNRTIRTAANPPTTVTTSPGSNAIAAAIGDKPMPS